MKLIRRKKKQVYLWYYPPELYSVRRDGEEYIMGRPLHRCRIHKRYNTGEFTICMCTCGGMWKSTLPNFLEDRKGHKTVRRKHKKVWIHAFSRYISSSPQNANFRKRFTNICTSWSRVWLMFWWGKEILFGGDVGISLRSWC